MKRWDYKIKKHTSFGLPIGYKTIHEVRSYVKLYRKLFKTRLIHEMIQNVNIINMEETSIVLILNNNTTIAKKGLMDVPTYSSIMKDYIRVTVILTISSYG